jgi:hypothetical protein
MRSYLCALEEILTSFETVVRKIMIDLRVDGPSYLTRSLIAWIQER